MIPAALEVGSLGYILLLVIFLILVGIMYTLGKRRSTAQSRADELKKRYAVITRETLDGLEDGQLVEAVVANLMAKTDEKDPDPYYVVMALSRGRRAVYSVWLTVHELAQGTFAQYRQTPSVRFSQAAADGFSLFGAPACAQALEEALKEDKPAGEEAFRQAVEKENPLALAAVYIRDNPTEFTDDASDTIGAAPAADVPGDVPDITSPDSTGQ